ncbi:unnamed protein product [Brassica rapa]|uniref:Uncharacterized protein n=1 Tax=Brassica campestris TaxID=3711 RepID=A0A8D9GN88_BRACM|nr:unnamed protein product [Brassica rapa]
MSRKKQVMAAGMVVVAGSHPWNSLVQFLVVTSQVADDEDTVMILSRTVLIRIFWKRFAWSHSSSYRYAS